MLGGFVDLAIWEDSDKVMARMKAGEPSLDAFCSSSLFFVDRQSEAIRFAHVYYYLLSSLLPSSHPERDTAL